jgi:hypothetical protein
MKPKSMILILGIVIILFISGYVWVSQSQRTQSQPDTARMIPPGILPTASREDLKDIILNKPDASMREKGVIAFTGLSLEQGVADDSVTFLKNITLSDKDENVRRTALASIGLIRSEHPLPKQAEMNITIEGHIQKNANITLRVDIISKTDQKRVRIGILHLTDGITLFTPQDITTTLSANQPANVQFVLAIHNEGKYIIPVIYIIDFDAFENEKVEKRVFLTVNNTDGTYMVIE